MLYLEKTFGTTEFVCDQRNCDYSEQFEGQGEPGYCDISGAAEEAKSYGWRITKKNGEWNHLCPPCNPDNKGEE